ncbi:hypothetical protein [Nocardia sp. NPDC004750]
MVKRELYSNPFLVAQFAGLTRLPLPTLGLPQLVRTVLMPLWLLLKRRHHRDGHSPPRARHSAPH